MAVKTGMLSTFDIAENKVDVSPILNMLKLPGTPVLNAIGFGQAVNATTLEWWDDVLPVLSTTLGASYTSGANSITVASTKGLRVGTIVQIDDTVYRVSAVSSDTVATVVLVSSADANHSNGVTVTILGHGAKQGEDYTDADYTQKVKRSNVTQIYTDYLKYTGTQLAVQQYVTEDVFLSEVKRKLERMMVWLERTIINGVKVAASDNTTPNLMGGIRYFIGANGQTTSTTWSEDNFKALLKKIVDANGSINNAWMHPTTVDKFLALNASKVIVQEKESAIGRVAKAYVSNYGEVNINVSNHIPASEILIFDPAKLKVRPLNGRAAFYEELAKTGDSRKGQIIGEYTLEFANSDVAGRFTITG